MSESNCIEIQENIVDAGCGPVIEDDNDNRDDVVKEIVDFSSERTTESAIKELEKRANVDTSKYKYTEIDCLDEDDPIPGQKYLLMSFVSPEGLMNCNVRGVKVKGVYATYKEAEAASERFKKKDKYFDIFIGEVGKWMPMDSNTKYVEKEKSRNKKLDKIMENVQQTEMKTLNEMVGRQKNAIDESKKKHNQRVKKSVKKSAQEYRESQDRAEQEDEEIVEESDEPKRSNKKIKEKRVGRGNHDPNVVKERLRKMMDAKKKKDDQSEGMVKLREDKEKQQNEADRLNEQKKIVSDLEQTVPEIDDKLRQMKELLRKKKEEKANEE